MQSIKVVLAVAILWNVANGSAISQTNPSPASENKLTVTVRTPAGKPLPHLTVVYVDPTTNAILRETTISGGRYRFTTDDKGQFEFTLKPENLYFMLATDAGFGLAQSRDLTNDPVITFQPWGHIEGIRLNRNRPMANQRIMLELSARCLNSEDITTRERVLVSAKTKTDSKGRFMFEHVPPGGIAFFEVERTKELWNFLLLTNLQPGEGKAIQVATEGRFVTGRLEVKDELPKDLNLADCDIYLAPTTPQPRMLPSIPKEFDTPEKRTPWWLAWYQTESAQLMFPRVDKRGTDFTVQSNGICTSDHFIAPGRYWISGDLVRNKKKIAKVDQYVEIPDDGIDTTNDPVDIGKILLKPAIQDGDLVPDFRVKTLDGEPLDLSSFRGKYVLLDFWATWCGPCVAETPNLKATYAAFGNDSRLAMISLSLDSDSDAPKRFVKTRDIHWTQGFLGDWGQDKVTKTFEVGSIPSIWLIGPDGKVISGGLGGPKIKEAVAAALANK